MGPDEAQIRQREHAVTVALEAFLKAGGERNPAKSIEAALDAVAYWEAARLAGAQCGGTWKPQTGLLSQ